jgi:hypothetical protein
MNTDTLAPPAVGHNRQRDDLDPELISDQLGLDYAHHLKRRDELIAGVARFVLANGTLARVASAGQLAKLEAKVRVAFVDGAGHLYQRSPGNGGWAATADVAVLQQLIGTVVIRDADIEARAVSFVRQLKDVAKSVETDRVREKTPYDTAAKCVQAFFAAGIVEKLAESAKAIERVINTYQRWKAEQERKRLADEAVAARAEADRLAKAAIASEHPDIIDTAVELATTAERKERAAAAPAAALARSRGAMGGTGSLRVDWEIEVLDLTKVPAKYLIADTAAMLRDVRAARGAIEITGVKISETSRTVVV